MRSSRGMGAVRTSKMPKGSTITRKDNPDKVRMFAKGGKVKKAEGGDVEFENTPASISSDITAPSYSFGEEFRAAREQGRKTFEYKGKKYTTEMAKPSAAKPAAAASKPAAAASKPAAVAAKPAAISPKPAAISPKPAASRAASRPTDKYTTRAELEMGRPYSNPPPFVGGIRKDTERFVEASRRPKPAATALEMGRPYSNPPPFVGGIRKDTERFVEASRRPKPAATAKPAASRAASRPTPPVLSSKDSRAPAVGAEAKAKRARLDNQERGMAKGGSANFIKGAIKKPGALRASLGAKPGKPIPAGKLDKASKAPGKLGQRARFAEMLRGFRKNKKQDG